MVLSLEVGVITTNLETQAVAMNSLTDPSKTSNPNPKAETRAQGPTVTVQGLGFRV